MSQPHSSDRTLLTLFERYARSSQPIETNFRQLVHWIGPTDRATHLLHPYPAKLLAHIPHFFLANRVLSKPGDTVLDPFCGSGTVLLEAILARRNAFGLDVNPLARLISSVKTTPLHVDTLRHACSRLLRRLETSCSTAPPDVVNLEYWFYPHVVAQLSRILHAVKQTRDPKVRDFFLVCLSACVRKVSLADPRLSVPVRLRFGQYPAGHNLREKTDAHLTRLRSIDVLAEFQKILQANCRRMGTLHSALDSAASATVVGNDARTLSRLKDNGRVARMSDGSVQIVITSPPYAGAQKYIRASSLSLGWLEFCKSTELKLLENQSIGREHYHRADHETPLQTGVARADHTLGRIHRESPIRAHIAGTYLIEMSEAINEIARVLRPNGYFVLVAGNNQVCNRSFETSEFLKSLAEQSGLITSLVLIDDIRSRGLMTKRNKTASLITREWVMIFQKRSTLSNAAAAPKNKNKTAQ